MIEEDIVLLKCFIFELWKLSELTHEMFPGSHFYSLIFYTIKKQQYPRYIIIHLFTEGLLSRPEEKKYM